MKAYLFVLSLFFVSSCAVQALPEFDLADETQLVKAGEILCKAYDAGDITPEDLIAIYKDGGTTAARQICERFFTYSYVDPETYDESLYCHTLQYHVVESDQNIYRVFVPLLINDIEALRDPDLLSCIVRDVSLDDGVIAKLKKRFGRKIKFKPVQSMVDDFFGCDGKPYSIEGNKTLGINADYLRAQLASNNVELDTLEPLDAAKNPITQTEGHLMVNRAAVVRYFKNKFKGSENYIAEFDAVHAKEREIIAQGRHPFVHSVRWEIFYHMYTRTKVWEMLHDKDAGDFLFLFDAVPEAELSSDVLKKEEKICAEIFKKGNTSSSWNGYDANRRKMLFMNSGIFCNTGDTGSCSADYTIRKRNINNFDCSDEQDKGQACSVSTKRVMKHLGLESVYTKKFKKRFDALRKKWNAMTPGSNPFVVLSFDDAALATCVYPAKPGGYTRMVTINGKDTRDVKKILHAYRTDPSSINNSDILEFVCVITKDFAGNANTQGVRMYYFHAADKAKWQEFNAELDALLADMKREIAQQKK